jgi:deoxyribonuclease IV
MPTFGAHLSIAGGVEKAAERARDIHADCLQLFVKSPSQWRFGPLADESVARFKAAAREAGLAPLVGHASYLLNLASPDDTLYERSRQCLLEEWDRCARLGCDGLVVHPGAHMGSGEAAGLARIALALDWLHTERPKNPTRLLLETAAGGGSELCGRFEHLRYILQSVAQPERLGVTLDTCHLFAAGYDLRTAAAADETLGRLDETVGLARVCVVHANDAKGTLGSHLDRHEHIGRGNLGQEAFRLLVNHPALAALPFILETPKEDARGKEMDPVNLRTLRRMVVPGITNIDVDK